MDLELMILVWKIVLFASSRYFLHWKNIVT